MQCSKSIRDALRDRNLVRSGIKTRFERKYPLIVANEVFGDWVTLDNEMHKNGQNIVMAKCKCGHISAVLTINLHSGKSKGCRKCSIANAQKNQKQYWGYVDICADNKLRRCLLNRISAAINRCHNPNDHNYKNYGARGIQVCDLWRKSKRDFLKYLMTIENIADCVNLKLEMDRIDVDKGYEPENIRFVSRSENAKNRQKIVERNKQIQDLKNEVEFYKKESLRYKKLWEEK